MPNGSAFVTVGTKRRRRSQIGFWSRIRHYVALKADRVHSQVRSSRYDIRWAVLMSRFVAITAVRDFEGRVRQAIASALHGELQTLTPDVLSGGPEDSVRRLHGAPPEVLILGPGVTPEAACETGYGLSTFSTRRSVWSWFRRRSPELGLRRQCIQGSATWSRQNWRSTISECSLSVRALPPPAAGEESAPQPNLPRTWARHRRYVAQGRRWQDHRRDEPRRWAGKDRAMSVVIVTWTFSSATWPRA